METPEIEPVEQEVNDNGEQQQAPEDLQGGPEDSQGGAQDNTDQPDEGWRRFAEERAAERAAKEERKRKELEKAEELRQIQEMLGLNTPANETPQEKKERLESLKHIDLPTGTDVESYVTTALDKWWSEKQQAEEQKRRELEQKQYPDMLRQAYSDINEVVTQENIDYLAYHYPEIAETYGDLPDGFSKYERLYKSIKKLVPQSNRRDAQRAQQNLAKPQATAGGSAVPSADSASGRLSSSQKQANYQRMLKEMGLA